MEEKTTEKKEVLPKKCTVFNCNFLRLRAKPTLDADTLELIPYGAVVEIASNYSNKIFYKVSYKDLEGYCVKIFLKKEM